MKKLNLNVKNMIEAYYNARRDMPNLWDAYLAMRYSGFITESEWDKFYEKCHSWDYCVELKCVVDENGKQVIL